VALVFGGEKRGLSDDELSLCQEIVVIPTHPQQPSMNLAQSAAILLYLCSRAEIGSKQPPEEHAAELRLIRALEEAMHQVLLTAGFLNPQAPDRVLRELQRSLLRGRLTQREAEMWLAAFRQLVRSVARTG
jgi:tRNA/rRNA methyltransferase